jgi:hypothetical protein
LRTIAAAAHKLWNTLPNSLQDTLGDMDISGQKKSGTAQYFKNSSGLVVFNFLGANS